MIHKNQVDWRAVAQDYARADCTIVELCLRHGVSRSAFYRHFKRKLVTSNAAHAQIPEAHNDLLARLTKALDDKMTKFEQRLQSGEPQSSADHEREARTLLSILRMFEKVSELSEDARPTPATAPAAKGFDADADTLRRQLAARLDKLRERDRG